LLSNWQILWRLLLAAVFGGLIGFEREFHGRAAGFRTHILVGIGSTLIMLTSIHIFDVYSGKAPCDPGRIAAGVVTGIGFLGAGTIMRSRASIRGLTTAASLWVVSGLGLAVGSGLYFASVVTTGITLITLLVFSRIEQAHIRRDWYRVLVVESRTGADQLKRIREAIANYDAQVKDFEVEKTDDASSAVLHISLKLIDEKHLDDIISDIKGIDGVKSARWGMA